MQLILPKNFYSPCLISWSTEVPQVREAGPVKSQFIGEETEIPGGCFADVTRNTPQARTFHCSKKLP